MKNLVLFVFGLLAACAVLKPSPGSNRNPLAIIADDSITTDEFLYAFNKNRNPDSTITRAEVDEYLDLYINFKLKVSEARARGLDTTKTFKKEYDSYISQLDNSYLQIGTNTDSLVKQAFSRLQYELNASHILFTLDEAALPEDTLKAYEFALSIRDSIVSGVNSFEEMAVRYSQDPSARQNKGQLGYFTVFQMVYPFETAAYATEIGEVSYPARTRFGYHLIKVNDKRPNEGRIRVAHIMVRNSDQAEQTAHEIYYQLKAGSNWDETCKKYSEDAQSASRGGELMPFSRSQIVPEFADAAFGLTNPDEITEPVQTPYGWHIIKLIERLPVNDFAANEQELRMKVRRDSRAQVTKNKMLLKLAAENNLIENDSTIQQLITPENHTYQDGKWLFSSDPLSRQIIFTINKEPYEVVKFYSFMAKIPGHQQTKDFLYEQYKNYKAEVLMEYEKAHLSEKYPEYTYLKQEYYDGILLFSIMETEVWQKAGTDSVGLAQFYEVNKENYRDSTTIEALIFSATNKNTIDSLAAIFTDYKIFEGISPTEKESLFNNNNGSSTLSLRLEQGEFNIYNHPVIVSLLDSGNTIIQENAQWAYIVPVRMPGEPRRMEMIKGQLIAGYQEALEVKWIEELRKKYPVTIDNQVLKTVYTDLDAQ